MSGVGTYHAVLTPKGKMISDLVGVSPRRLRHGVAILLDVPSPALPGFSQHFGAFFRLALPLSNDVSARYASISVVGPEAVAAVPRLALGLRVEPTALEATQEGAGLRPGLRARKTARRWRGCWSPGQKKCGPMPGPSSGLSSGVRALWAALVADGATPAGLGVWATLRVEAGRPVFGTDMDEATLPPEAGIVERAIDQTKGCYTGQEVIVRIRDRGHVNRQLCVLELGDVPAPAKGAELLATDGSGKVVGRLTSVRAVAEGGGRSGDGVCATRGERSPAWGRGRSAYRARSVPVAPNQFCSSASAARTSSFSGRIR